MLDHKKVYQWTLGPAWNDGWSWNFVVGLEMCVWLKKSELEMICDIGNSIKVWNVSGKKYAVWILFYLDTRISSFWLEIRNYESLSFLKMKKR